MHCVRLRYEYNDVRNKKLRQTYANHKIFSVTLGTSCCNLHVQYLYCTSIFILQYSLYMDILRAGSCVLIYIAAPVTDAVLLISEQ